jgi:hypothetical protein
MSALRRRTFVLPASYGAMSLGRRAVVGLGLFVSCRLTSDWRRRAKAASSPQLWQAALQNGLDSRDLAAASSPHEFHRRLIAG